MCVCVCVCMWCFDTDARRCSRHTRSVYGSTNRVNNEKGKGKGENIIYIPSIPTAAF